MHKLLTSLFLLAFTVWHAQAQQRPAENSELNYRLIGFSFDAPAGQSKWLQIADGNISDIASFKKHIIATLPCKGNKMIAEVPAFGRSYTWRIAGGKDENILHHFATGTLPAVDTGLSRLRITRRAEKYKDAYVFIEGSRALYDMNGRPVWYLPKNKDFENTAQGLRDFKLTPQGTITFLSGEKAFEVNYNGAILWRGHKGQVSGDSIEHYHHELTRLKNGHYMVMGEEYLGWRNGGNGEIVYYRPDSATGKPPGDRKMAFGTVIEYDEQGHVVWRWRSADYYTNTELFRHRVPEPNKDEYTVHSNACFFDEQHGYVYLGFKNTSQVMKVKYPEGTVAAVYGNVQAAQNDTAAHLFCQQHSCRISQKGYLYIYNNNVCHERSLPSVVVLQEPASGNEPLKKIWEYTYPEQADPTRPWMPLTNGGNAIELPDGSMFVSQCSPYCTIFIVGHDKKIYWSAVYENRKNTSARWEQRPQYRANIVVNRKDMEPLVWNTEK